jgi:hypothetical protein
MHAAALPAAVSAKVQYLVPGSYCFVFSFFDFDTVVVPVTVVAAQKETGHHAIPVSFIFLETDWQFFSLSFFSQHSK